jgi:hypothetical protein
MSSAPTPMPRFLATGFLGLAAAVVVSVAEPGPLPVGSHRAKRSVDDEPFFQEVRRPVADTTPLKTVVVGPDRHAWAGGDAGLFRLDGARLVKEDAPEGPVRRLVIADGRLWAITGSGLHRRDAGGWTTISKEPVADLAAFRDAVWAAAGPRLYRVKGDGLEPATSHAARFGITRLVPHQGTLWVHGPGRLAPFAAGRFGGLDAYTWPSDQAWDWGTLPSPITRDVLSLDTTLWIATDRGLGELRGMSLMSLKGDRGLPFEDTTCLARGFEDDLWIGTTHGAIRRAEDGWRYYAGQRWLPGDRVEAIAVDPAGSGVYVATDRGLGVIDHVPMTLEAKAAYYERHLEAWGQKRLGFVHKLEWDAARKEYVREVSDNDGGYSGNFLAAEVYRYAATGDPEARREATNTFHAIRWLEAMTGIPGFPARSVWVKGEVGHQAGHGSGGYAAEWHDTADGRFEWKGDTSSDELCSQFYSVGLFLELAAEGAEKAQARDHLARIARHLVRHRWTLVDLDGKPTRWGRWDPEYFLSDEGRYDRGLQALELLSFLKTAEVVTGEPEFAEAYRELVRLGYPEHTLRASNTFPPESVLHFLDEMNFWCSWNLLRHEKDPDLLALYRRAYERAYEAVRVEENPWFDFLHGALTGAPVDLAAAREHLRSWPLDLRAWSYRNSQRADLRTPPGKAAVKGGTRTFVPRETEPLRWDHWLMQADGGAGGQDVVEPGAWLLAYWMGRHHGFIAAPDAKAASAAGVKVPEIPAEPAPGAKPYAGPGRPEGF